MGRPPRMLHCSVTRIPRQSGTCQRGTPCNLRADRTFQHGAVRAPRHDLAVELPCVAVALQHHLRQTDVRRSHPTTVRRTGMAVVTPMKPPQAPSPKDLYEIGEIPPLGHVPERMHAWAIRKERHGPPESAMQVEVVPTWPIGDDEVL